MTNSMTVEQLRAQMMSLSKADLVSLAMASAAALAPEAPVAEAPEAPKKKGGKGSKGSGNLVAVAATSQNLAEHSANGGPTWYLRGTSVADIVQGKFTYPSGSGVWILPGKGRTATGTPKMTAQVWTQRPDGGVNRGTISPSTLISPKAPKDIVVFPEKEMPESVDFIWPIKIDGAKYHPVLSAKGRKMWLAVCRGARVTDRIFKAVTQNRQASIWTRGAMDRVQILEDGEVVKVTELLGIEDGLLDGEPVFFLTFSGTTYVNGSAVSVTRKDIKSMFQAYRPKGS